MPYYRSTDNGNSQYYDQGRMSSNSPHHERHSSDDMNSHGPAESSSKSSVTEPTYLMEHLATFTVTKESGIMYANDGMRRLLQLEKCNGIWSQKMQLRLEKKWVLIMDHETGVVMEKFPASLIQDPTAFTSSDPSEMYNNILVFTVPDESQQQKAEMHIFQCQSVSAKELAEDLKMLQTGKLNMSRNHHPHHQIPPPPTLPPPELPENHHHHDDKAILDENNEEISSTSSDKYERDVSILNHCFDDIEKFIARLQHAAAASRELERRRRSRKSKKRSIGDGMLSMRAKPPPKVEFVDIFQKFKLSFNLLAKLKAHIHDPNAPELVHFLFTPLALIVDASRDTNGDSNLPEKVVSPLLTREAVNLLMNCVTSKETELWHSLGDAWIVPRDQWKGSIPPYQPVFMDGWSPDGGIGSPNQSDHLTSLLQQDRLVGAPETAPGDPYLDESNYSGEFLDHYDARDESYIEDDPRAHRSSGHHARAHSDISVDSIERNPRGGDGPPSGGMSMSRAQEAWLDDLLTRRAKVVQVTYPRTANNDKEMTVVRGEYLEILDDSRKWWKARNCRGQVAHVPHTIVTQYSPGGGNNGDYDQDYPGMKYGGSRHTPVEGYDSSEIGVNNRSPDMGSNHQHAIIPAAPADWVRKERLGKKGEFRYF